MRRLMLLGIALLISCQVYADSPYAFTPAEKQWIQEHPVVRYAIDSYWPLEYIENGEHKGLTRDYLQQISRISGLQFELVPTKNWSETLALIDAGKIDLTTAVSKALIDKDQAGKLLLSDVFFVGSTVVVTRSGEPVLFSTHKLNGKVVAVKGGGGYEHYLRKEFPDVELLLINDPEDALMALAEGKADAVIGMDSVLQLIISRKFFGTLHLAGVLSDMPIVSSMGISPKYPELLSIINKSLAQLPPSTIDAIFERWLERTDYGAPSWATVFRYYRIELICFALLLSALAFMTRRAMLAKKAAQKSEAAKSSFLAMMSHEIRTPMNGVLSSIELLKGSPLTPAQQELATLANVSARNLLELLDDVLDVSKLEADKIQLESVPTDLQQLARGLADIHQLAARQRHTEISLAVTGLDEVLLILDPVRIRQVIANLLSNAVKFTEHGEVLLSLHFEATSSDSGHLEILVSDTGIGVDAQQQRHLFQAFVQADNSITRRYGGSGLGLSICKQLVELMGGQIDLESEPGQGTRVRVSLPVSFRHKYPALPARAAEEPLPDAPAKTWQQVLVVEDHPINRQTIQLQLTELGYHALIVEDGIAAMATMEQHREGICLILLDCHLPGIDGYEVARRIRQQEQEQGLAHMPIIAISASTDEQHQLKCIDSEIDGNLSKPLTLSALRQILGLWLPGPDTPPQPVASSLSSASIEDLFNTSCGEDFACLHDAFDKHNLVLALHYSHRLHGAALAMQANELAKRARDMEQALRDTAGQEYDWSAMLTGMEEALKSFYLSRKTGP